MRTDVTPSPTRAPGTEFNKLWIGYSISRIGSQITLLALPLAAILLLGAGATETGLLVAARTAPIALAGPFIGVCVDRHPRRPVLIATAVGNAIAIGTIPAAAVLGVLSLPQLYAVSLLAGTFSTASQNARSAIIPALVGRARLVRSNARLQASDSVAQVAGPSLGGALVQALTAPIAIAVDAASFLAAAVLVATIRLDERSTPRASRRRFWHEIAEGLSWVRDHQVLMRAVVAIALANIEWFAVQALLVVYATKELALSPALLGISLAAAGPFSVIGAAVVGPLASRWGLGPTMIVALILEAASRLVLPFAAGDEIRAAAVLMFTQALVGLTVPLWSVSFVTLQQAMTPDRLLGRVWSAASLMQWGVAPPAALGAGLLGDAIGLRPTLFIAGAIAVIAVAYIAASPVRSFRSVPQSAVSAQGQA